MAGWLTDGMQQVVPLTQNAVVNSPVPSYTNLNAAGLIAVDTTLGSGQAPQTVAATSFQVACDAMSLIANQATSTVHAATLNTVAGFITTEALTTAPGATYTFTLTNSLLVAGAAAPQVQVRGVTNTAGSIQITSVVNATGSTVITLTNVGTAAFNGTIGIGFHI